LLYRNLRLAGLSEEEVAGARSARRRTLVANEMLFRAVAPVVSALEGSGVRTVMLKGVSLALRHYEDPGLRPMGDVDLLVRPRDVAPAVEIFARFGFRARVEPTARRMQLLHAEDFEDARGHHVDLHWRLHPHRRHIGHLQQSDHCQGREGLDEDLWSRIEPFPFAGTTSHALGAADELLHQLVHGLHWSPVPSIRWVADSCGILANAALPVDWKVFVAAARSARSVTAAFDGLSYLRDAFGAAVPASVLDELSASPDAFVDRWEYRLGTRRSTYTVAGGLPLFAIRYGRETRERGAWPHPAGFLRFLRELWACDSEADVLRRMAGRGFARAWSSLSGRPLPPLESGPREN
jgi:hypothetical protein